VASVSEVVGSDVASWQCTEPLPPERHRMVIREMNLHGFKWDTQVGDVSCLAPFALVLPRREWNTLAALAEALSAELSVLESRIEGRPDLWRRLGLPRTLLNELGRGEPWTPTAVRVVRYDFHPTGHGYRISEVNSDVPGGFTESSTFTALMAVDNPGFAVAGDPLRDVSAALARSCDTAGVVALLAAPGYLEDLQVVHAVAARLRSHAVRSVVCRPEQIVWDQGRALVRSDGRPVPIGAIYRFYQGEWLVRAPTPAWRLLLRGGKTSVCNPAVSLLTESKRLPLLWQELDVPMPSWSSLLPETAASRLHSAEAHASGY